MKQYGWTCPYCGIQWRASAEWHYRPSYAHSHCPKCRGMVSVSDRELVKELDNEEE